MKVDLLDGVDEWGPEKVVCVSDSRTGMRGVLVIDNTARGMGKGGTRMALQLSVSEVARLARVMTWKWAAADLFYGGAKAGVRCDPASPDRELVLRAFVRALRNEVPREYVFGLDMGLTEADAAVIQDELGDRGASVGAPAGLGGLPYDELGVTGFGVAVSVAAASEVLDQPVAGARVAIQGFGAVGHAAAKELDRMGAVIVAISTINGVLYNPDGLDVAALLERRCEEGEAALQTMPGAEILVTGEELLLDVDVLIPAATQDVIDAAVAAEIRAGLVVEGANLPTTSEALEVLNQRGVVVIPDFIANAGGIVAAAHAMEARRSPFRPQVSAVLDAVASTIRSNTHEVLLRASRASVSPHKAARKMAQDRVSDAMRLRGTWPKAKV